MIYHEFNTPHYMHNLIYFAPIIHTPLPLILNNGNNQKKKPKSE